MRDLANNLASSQFTIPIGLGKEKRNRVGTSKDRLCKMTLAVPNYDPASGINYLLSSIIYGDLGLTAIPLLAKSAGSLGGCESASLRVWWTGTMFLPCGYLPGSSPARKIRQSVTCMHV